MILTTPDSPGLRARYEADRDHPHWVVESIETPPIAQLVFVHGLCEHAFRFFPLARWLAARGIRTALFHQPGHGVPANRAEEFLFLAELYFRSDDPSSILEGLALLTPSQRASAAEVQRECYQQMKTIDLERVVAQTIGTLAQVAKGAEGLPLLLGGHSLGGLIATIAAARTEIAELGTAKPENANPESAGTETSETEFGLAGVFLSSPALRARGSLRGGKLEQCFVDFSFALGKSPIFWPLHRAFGRLARLNWPIGVGWASDSISDITAEGTLHAEDPLILEKVPSGYLARIQSLMIEAARLAREYPVYSAIYAAEDDRIVHTEGTATFAALAQANHPQEHTRLEFFDAFFPHDLLRSSAREQVLASLEPWLEAAIGRKLVAPSS